MIFLNHPQFLPPFSPIPNNIVEFCGTDSKDLFDKNINKKESSWYYRTNKVEYKFNHAGYRTDEWKDIDWSNSIVVFGGSDVLGVGLIESDTISSQISRMLGRTTVNLGAGGTSMFFSFYNSVILKKHFPTPWAVVHIWSSVDRFVYFDDKNISILGPWELQNKFFNRNPTNTLYNYWSKSKSNTLNQTAYMPFVSPIIWNNTRFYQASFFEETSNNNNIDFLQFYDHARDDIHIGKETAYNTASIICNNLG